MPFPTPLPVGRLFPNPQRLLIEHLEAYAGAGRAGIGTPPDLAAKLPFIRVQLIPGGSGLLNAYNTVAVDVFDLTYDDADRSARELREHLCANPLCPVPGIDRITCEGEPGEQPWGDGTIRRFAAHYRTVARRRAAT